MTRTSHVLAADGRVWLRRPCAARAGPRRSRRTRARRPGRRPASCSTATTATAPPSPASSGSRTSCRRTRSPGRRSRPSRQGVSPLARAGPSGGPRSGRWSSRRRSARTGSSAAGDERVGVHLLLRLTPPRDVPSRFAPEHLLLGHGEGLHGPDAAAGLRAALAAPAQVSPASLCGSRRSRSTRVGDGAEARRTHVQSGSGIAAGLGATFPAHATPTPYPRPRRRTHLRQGGLPKTRRAPLGGGRAVEPAARPDHAAGGSQQERKASTARRSARGRRENGLRTTACGRGPRSSTPRTITSRPRSRFSTSRSTTSK